jgi:hypothetical protein
MPTFQRDPVAYALALADPTSTPTDARLARHDAELANRYQRNGQLGSVLESRGIPATDAALSAVMLLSEIFVARHAALPQAVDRACAYYRTVLAGAGGSSAWHAVEPPARGARAFVPSRSALDRMVPPSALAAEVPVRSRGAAAEAGAAAPRKRPPKQAVAKKAGRGRKRRPGRVSRARSRGTASGR